MLAFLSICHREFGMSTRLAPGMFVTVTSVLTGCSLFNPYVKAPDASPRGECNALLRNADVENADAFSFAQCVRDDMDSRAGSYASLSNGGSAFLLGLAGLTTYRAFRGDNDANVQALATGGATLYAAQKYLYRKPREAIYATGSATIDCAIGITMRRVALGKQSLGTDVTHAEASLKEANDARHEAADFLTLPEPNNACPASTRNTWREAKSLLSAADDSTMRSLQDRIPTIRVRLDRLISGAALAAIDLITLTKNVRGVVNRQLALEQPDPAEIASSLAVLKLPPVEGTASETGAEGQATKGASATVGTKGAPLRGEFCNVDETRADQFATIARRFDEQFRGASIRIRELEAHLSRLESGGGAATDAMQLQQVCSFHHFNAALPFDVMPAERPQKVTAGTRVLVPIEGGVSPFVANLATTPKEGTLGVSAKALNDGEHAFEVTASANATAGTYLIISNDDAGASRSFQVQIVAAPATARESAP